MTPQEALNRLIDNREIFHDEMLSVMRQIMGGEMTSAQIAGILLGLRVKKETIGEITAAAQVMREFATHVPVADATHLVDTCGTGGDGAHTFNVSTCAALVAAAAGAKVAKHGGRSVSSKSGSADVLEALGVNVNLTPEQAARAIDQIGIGFMFAPNYHSAMKHAAPVRRELGVRTIFNILGPLTNPAGARNQLLGVFHPDLVGIQVRVLQRLGSRHVMVVHGALPPGPSPRRSGMQESPLPAGGRGGGEGMDEISICGETMVGELKGGEVSEYIIHPAQFGLRLAPPDAIRVSDAGEARGMLLGVLDNVPGPARDMVLLNAGASIYLAAVAKTLERGIEKAAAAVESGAARAKLHQLVEFSNRFK